MPFFVMDISKILPGDNDLISGLCYQYGFAGLEEFEHSMRLVIEEDTPEKLTQIGALLGDNFPHLDLAIQDHPLVIENWQDNWKAYFQPISLGSFTVYPPWEAPIPGLIPVIIDPKMAFGTGTHESTQMIIESLEMSEIKDRKILDIGCGSGILSIAAEKLKAETVVGIDIDPVAIENARENAVINDSSRINFEHMTIEELDDNDFDVIFANIVKNVLLDISRPLTEHAGDNCKIHLSGLLENDIDSILHEYQNLGFKLLAKKQKGEWRSLIFARGQ